MALHMHEKEQSFPECAQPEQELQALDFNESDILLLATFEYCRIHAEMLDAESGYVQTRGTSALLRYTDLTDKLESRAEIIRKLIPENWTVTDAVIQLFNSVKETYDISHSRIVSHETSDQGGG